MSIQYLIYKNVMRYQMARFYKEPSVNGRRAILERAAGYQKLPRDVVMEPMNAGTIPAEWITTPGVRDDWVHLHLHGGAYYTGSISTVRDLVARIGRAAGMRSLAIAYRLAPEHPYPAALADATSAYQWLLRAGFDPAKIILTGDSSGGGLALATLVNLRETDAPLPAGAVCLSPWTDLTLTGDSVKSKAKVDFVNKLSEVIRMRTVYPGGHDLKTPLISPLYANLSGLPPLLIQVGTEDILFDDSTRLAKHARAAGVQVTLDVWEGMMHVFQFSAGFVPEARRAIAAVGAFMRQRVEPEVNNPPSGT